MKKTLYIVTKAPGKEGFSLLPSTPASRENSSVVLAQDGVTHQGLSFSRVFALSDDVIPKKSTSPFPFVSYEGLLRMIFEEDNVAVL